MTDEEKAAAKLADDQKLKESQAAKDAQVAKEQQAAKDKAAAETKQPLVEEAPAQKVDADLAARNAANEEGHAKNMQQVEQDAMEAQMRTEHADDPRARHVPTGKEQNHNTPRVLSDGTKVWD